MVADNLRYTYRTGYLVYVSVVGEVVGLIVFVYANVGSDFSLTHITGC